MIVHLKHGYVAFASGHLVSSCFSYPILCWKLYQYVAYRCGRPPCVKHETTNDGVVGRGAIDDKETNLLSKLPKVRPDGYWQNNGSDGKDFGSTESHQWHV